MHVCNLIHFLQSRLFALRADGYRVVGEVLKYLGLLQAIIAMVNVDGHYCTFLYAVAGLPLRVRTLRAVTSPEASFALSTAAALPHEQPV